ncbi:MAG TPA: PKD domain-containing protein, partial [Eudoraea sp.]|nr:PKD domain-containing protein [Eudoraea sp.]
MITNLLKITPLIFLNVFIIYLVVLSQNEFVPILETYIPGGPNRTLINVQTNPETSIERSEYILTLTQNVNINNCPEVSLSPFDTVCPGTPAFDLTGGSPEGGTYSGDFVTDGMFDPVASGQGSFVITYTFEDESGCMGSASQTLTVGSGAPAQVVIDDIFNVLETNFVEFTYEDSVILPAGVDASGTITTPENPIHFNGAKEFQYDQVGNEITVNLAVTDVSIDFLLELTVEVLGLSTTENITGVASIGSINGSASYIVEANGNLTPNANATLEINNFDLSFQGGGILSDYLSTFIDLSGPLYENLITGVLESAILNWLEAPTFTLETIQNASVAFMVPSPACQGQEMVFTDNSVASAIATYNWDFGDGQTSDVNGDVSYTYGQPGEYTVTLTINDGGCEQSHSENVIVNPSPEVSLSPFDTVCPGTPAFDLTGGSPEGGTYSGDFVNDGMFDPVASGQGSFVITYTFEDESGCMGSASQTLTIDNNLPILSNFSVPVEPVQLGTTVSISVNFLDTNLYGVSIDWGDGNLEAGIIENDAIFGNHIYTMPGVYELTIHATDACDETSTLSYQYVVVFDPSSGFVTGGGWFESPMGAYYQDATLTGKANFGFVSKYKKGQSVPDGNTEFQFQTANLNFKSTSYDWLIVAGTKAMLKGNGNING